MGVYLRHKQEGISNHRSNLDVYLGRLAFHRPRRATARRPSWEKTRSWYAAQRARFLFLESARGHVIRHLTTVLRVRGRTTTTIEATPFLVFSLHNVSSFTPCSPTPYTNLASRYHPAPHTLRHYISLAHNAQQLTFRPSHSSHNGVLSVRAAAATYAQTGRQEKTRCCR